MKNALYYGDNLDVLRRYVADESVALVYLDPPFNSAQNYNVLFQEQDGNRSCSATGKPHTRKQGLWI
jgi:site-specific DNA-methyltransferase (adenine-specific)